MAPPRWTIVIVTITAMPRVGEGGPDRARAFPEAAWRRMLPAPRKTKSAVPMNSADERAQALRFTSQLR